MIDQSKASEMTGQSLFKVDVINVYDRFCKTYDSANAAFALARINGNVYSPLSVSDSDLLAAINGMAKGETLLFSCQQSSTNRVIVNMVGYEND